MAFEFFKTRTDRQTNEATNQHSRNFFLATIRREGAKTADVQVRHLSSDMGKPETITKTVPRDRVKNRDKKLRKSKLWALKTVRLKAPNQMNQQLMHCGIRWRMIAIKHRVLLTLRCSLFPSVYPSQHPGQHVP